MAQTVMIILKSVVVCDTISYEIIVELDLVKGVFIRFGWDPRR